MNKLQYFCKSCSLVKPAKLDENGQEIFKTFKQSVKNPNGQISKETKDINTRLLECGHRIPTYVPGFTDSSNENLNEYETAHLRNLLDKAMIGKNSKELEEAILFHVDQYQTLLKIASKQKQQSKYAIQYLDQLRERYSKTLSNEDDKIKFDTKFAHFLDLKPTTNKVKERERTETERAADKLRAAKEAVKELYRKTGYDPKQAFGSGE